MANKIMKEFIKGIFKDNPVFVLLLGLCPTLGVTSSAINGLAMGLATMAVLIGSNVIISILKSVIPDKIRIPAYILVIATLVTVLQMTMHAYLFELYKVLGLFIPLIVVNCIILGRAEAYASKNNVFYSLIDALGIGLGFTLALVVLGSVREILGNASLFGFSFLADAGEVFQPVVEKMNSLATVASSEIDTSFKPALIFILAPGAFLAMGLLMAGINKIKSKKQ